MRLFFLIKKPQGEHDWNLEEDVNTIKQKPETEFSSSIIKFAVNLCPGAQEETDA